MKYTFTCPREHGSYEVDKTTFETFLTPGLREKLKSRQHDFEAELVFKGFCPRCKMAGKTHATLHVRKAKSQH